MIRLLYLVLGFVLCTRAVTAQVSFFQPLPKPAAHFVLGPAGSFSRQAIPASGVIKQQAWRPVLNALTYSEPDHILLAGAGIAHQWLHYVDSSQRWQTDVSINLLFYGGGNIAPPNSALYGTGISVGILNNMLTVGGLYNFAAKKVGVTLGINVNLNN